MRGVRKDNAETLLNDLKSRPIQRALATAINRNRKHLGIAAGVLSTSLSPKFQFVGTDHVCPYTDFDVEKVV